MADKKTKIQPADNADEQVGQPSAEEATGDLPDYTAEQIAGMKPDEVVKKLSDAKAFIKSATQKSQEAAEIRRQSEQLKAESKYWKTQAEEATKNMQKFYEQISQSTQQPAQSTPSQPPDYDPYNPDKWAQQYQKWHEEQLSSTRSEFRKEMDELKKNYEDANLSVRTLRLEKYLEKAIPELGPDVSVEEIHIWAQQHPDADFSNMETINQAIRERQTYWDEKAKKIHEKYVAKKEELGKGAQEVPGSELAGEMPNIDEFVEATPAEKDKKVMEYFNRAARKVQGGGG